MHRDIKHGDYITSTTLKQRKRSLKNIASYLQAIKYGDAPKLKIKPLMVYMQTGKQCSLPQQKPVSHYQKHENRSRYFPPPPPRDKRNVQEIGKTFISQKQINQ